jgi:hypothetical protein
MAENTTDPPITPQDGTTVWFETPPSVITDDPQLAALMVRVGMAANALNAQLDAVRHLAAEPGARRNRSVLAALVNSAAIINESLRLTQGT